MTKREYRGVLPNKTHEAILRRRAIGYCTGPSLFYVLRCQENLEHQVH